MATYSGFPHWKLWFSIVMLVYQRVAWMYYSTVWVQLRKDRVQLDTAAGWDDNWPRIHPTSEHEMDIHKLDDSWYYRCLFLEPRVLCSHRIHGLRKWYMLTSLRCHQTWLAGKSPNQIDGFSIGVLDYRRVNGFDMFENSMMRHPVPWIS